MKLKKTTEEEVVESSILMGRLATHKITQVDAGWRKFDIIFLKDLREEGEKCWGKIDFDKCELFLEHDMDDSIARETILHEILHIVLNLVGFDKEHTEGEIISTNEEMVTRITRGLMVLINLNEKLFKILMNKV